MKFNSNTFYKKGFLFAGLSLATVFTSCQDDDTEPVIVEAEGTASLMIDARFGDADFELEKAFQAASGDRDISYSFSRLRYWVSNIALIDENGVEFKVPDSYFLMEETGEVPVQDGSFDKVYPANKREVIELSDIPAGNYTGLKFNIGVDPMYNDNLSLRAGELNALNGMASASWMWFTSYIFTSAAGQMALASDTDQVQNFFWETGSNDMLAAKEIEFPNMIRISSSTASSIDLELDVQQVMNLDGAWDASVIGATQVDEMARLRDNYVNAISIQGASSIEK